MTVKLSIDPALPWVEQIDRAEPGLLRALLKTFVEALMGAEADAVCGASYGVRSEERVNSHNGYRLREWDTRAGTVELVVVKWMVAGPDGQQQAHGDLQAWGKNALPT